uniref:Uncharacterized protein n=1 Tax=Panagrellus redivivus TaxID=6233 RepID=A0A7E4VJC5_PANRE
MERNTIFSGDRKDVQKGIGSVPQPSNSPSSAQGPRTLPILTTTPFKVGHKFFHASGKVFIVCEDHVIREVYQPPANQASK